MTDHRQTATPEPPAITPHAALPARATGTLARPWRLLALGLILLAGAALRMTDLEHTPYGIWFDEAINGMDAVNVWRPGGHFQMYYSVDIGFPHEPMFQTALNLVVGLFGPSVVAVRMVSATLGLVTVLLVYLFARRFLGEHAGLASAGVLATLRWHALFSHLSFRTLILGPWMLGLVWAALACRRRPTTARAALLGVFIGGGFYTYLSWWFLLPAVALAVALTARRAWRRPGGRRALAVLALAAALTYLPMGRYFIQHPDIVTKRGKAVSIFAGGPAATTRAIIKNAGEAALMFHFWGDHVPVQNLSGPGSLAALVFKGLGIDPAREKIFIGNPALDPIQGVAFILGAVLAFRLMWRRRGKVAAHRPASSASALALLLFTWFLCGLTSTILTQTDSPNFLRTLCLTPVVAILTGLGLAGAGRWIARRRGVWAGAALVALALGTSGAQTAWSIYGDWAKRADVWHGFHGDLTDLARAASQAGPELAVMVPADLARHPAFQFQTATRNNIIPYSTWSELLGPWPSSSAAKPLRAPRARWVIVTAANGLYQPLTTLIPEAREIKAFQAPERNTWALMLSIPEDALPAVERLKQIQQGWLRPMSY